MEVLPGKAARSVSSHPHPLIGATRAESDAMDPGSLAESKITGKRATLGIVYSNNDGSPTHAIRQTNAETCGETEGSLSSPHQGSKVPVPNRRLVPGSREKRGKTGKNGEKRRKNGGKPGTNGGNLGGGYFGQDLPTRLLPPPPPFIILLGAFFANQIEAKALSRVRHPSPKG